MDLRLIYPAVEPQFHIRILSLIINLNDYDVLILRLVVKTGLLLFPLKRVLITLTVSFLLNAMFRPMSMFSSSVFSCFRNIGHSPLKLISAIPVKPLSFILV